MSEAVPFVFVYTIPTTSGRDSLGPCAFEVHARSRRHHNWSDGTRSAELRKGTLDGLFRDHLLFLRRRPSPGSVSIDDSTARHPKVVPVYLIWRLGNLGLQPEKRKAPATYLSTGMYVPTVYRLGHLTTDDR